MLNINWQLALFILLTFTTFILILSILRKVSKISTTTISRWKKQLMPIKHRNKKPVKIDYEALKRDIHDHPDSYSYERALKLGVSASGIRYAIKRLGISYKKTLNHPKVDCVKRSMFCQRIKRLQSEWNVIACVDKSDFAALRR